MRVRGASGPGQGHLHEARLGRIATPSILTATFNLGSSAEPKRATFKWLELLGFAPEEYEAPSGGS
jgi:hypothetical protein